MPFFGAYGGSILYLAFLPYITDICVCVCVCVYVSIAEPVRILVGRPYFLGLRETGHQPRLIVMVKEQLQLPA